MNTVHTRRQFLKQSVLGGSLAATVPAFIASTFERLQAGQDRGKEGPILVVLQLAGGNDGLNTLVPHGNDHYRKARPTLGIPSPAVLRLDDQFGFHPALKGFKALYDEGHLAAVHAVGYPNPNRSHFRSAEIWATGSSSDRVERHGWIGRYFDNACAGEDPTVGIAIGRQQPQAFAGTASKGISMERPENYRFVEGSTGRNRMDEDEKHTYREMAGSMDADGDEDSSGGTIGALAGGGAAHPDPRAFLERTALDAQLSSDLIRRVTTRPSAGGSYPTTAIGQSLRLIGQLIGGGLPTRIYYASQGGYDTHTRQKETHERLLRELGDATHAFVKDLKAQGALDRVLMMTFSEFGRRVSENASAGTDHGAAAPLFLVGGRLKPGLHGTAPDLAPERRVRGDVRHSTDFRQVYATVLERWLGTPSKPVLGGTFTPLPLLV